MAGIFFAETAETSYGGETWADKEAPRSRVSAVVSMLGDFMAFAASFLILGDVIAAGALLIPQFYGHAAQPKLY